MEHLFKEYKNTNNILSTLEINRYTYNIIFEFNEWQRTEKDVISDCKKNNCETKNDNIFYQMSVPFLQNDIIFWFYHSSILILKNWVVDRWFLFSYTITALQNEMRFRREVDHKLYQDLS